MGGLVILDTPDDGTVDDHLAGVVGEKWVRDGEVPQAEGARRRGASPAGPAASCGRPPGRSWRWGCDRSGRG